MYRANGNSTFSFFDHDKMPHLEEESNMIKCKRFQDAIMKYEAYYSSCSEEQAKSNDVDFDIAMRSHVPVDAQHNILIDRCVCQFPYHN